MATYPHVYNRVRATGTTTGTGSFTAATAATGFVTLSAGVPSSGSFYYVIQNQGAFSEWEIGIGTHSGSGVFTRDTVIASSNAGALVNFSVGTKDVFVTAPATIAEGPSLKINGGRLTPATGNPFTLGPHTAVTNIYFTPAKGDVVYLYDTTLLKWFPYIFSEITISLAAKAANTNFDVFVYDSGGAVVAESVAWSVSTAGGSVRDPAHAVSLFHGVWTKTSDRSRRLVGTYRTTTTIGQTELSATKLYVANVDNPIDFNLYVSATASHTTSSGPGISWNSDATNKVEIVIPIATTMNPHIYGTAWNNGVIGFVFNATTPFSNGVVQNNGAAVVYIGYSSKCDVSVGFHQINACEASAGGTANFSTYALTVPGKF